MPLTNSEEGYYVRGSEQVLEIQWESDMVPVVRELTPTARSVFCLGISPQSPFQGLFPC